MRRRTVVQIDKGRFDGETNNVSGRQRLVNSSLYYSYGCKHGGVPWVAIAIGEDTAALIAAVEVMCSP